MKNISLVIASSIFFVLSILLFSNINQQKIYSQNITTTTIEEQKMQVAEDFKDCFLDIKANYDLYGSNVNTFIMRLCYETYKGEGVFNHQLSEEQQVNINQKIFELRKSSDLDKILKAFQ